jgi:hypothetical protein
MLNSVLLQCAPNDPPPPRRSKRSTTDDVTRTIDTQFTRKGLGGSVRHNTHINAVDCDAHNLRPVTMDPPIPENDSSETLTQRKRVARNVGGWISPDFSNDINRSWMENEVPSDRFDLSSYVPQVGDTVL